jgi:hypothetical protein
LTATFAACSAQQAGLSPSDAISLGSANTALSRSVRPEQKTTPILAPFRVTTDSFSIRKQPLEAGRTFSARDLRYVLKIPATGLRSLCSQSNLGETTRGPPPM